METVCHPSDSAMVRATASSRWGRSSALVTIPATSSSPTCRRASVARSVVWRSSGTAHNLVTMEAATAGERREALKAVYDQACGCTRCPQLAATRQSVVFGAGNADADLMFVGEAPGANEDQQGRPFVGAAGKLLEQLLAEIGLQRSDVFISNVLKCRPPQNRDPLPQEIDNCQDSLFRQIELIEPAVICTLG